MGDSGGERVNKEKVREKVAAQECNGVFLIKLPLCKDWGTRYVLPHPKNYFSSLLDCVTSVKILIKCDYINKCPGICKESKQGKTRSSCDTTLDAHNLLIHRNAHK